MGRRHRFKKALAAVSTALVAHEGVSNQKSSRSTAAMIVTNENINVNINGPTLKQLVTALDLEVPDGVLDLVTSTEPLQTSRDRLRQKFARKKVVAYASAVQEVRRCSKKIQVCRDKIMLCEADLVMLNLRRHCFTRGQERTDEVGTKTGGDNDQVTPAADIISSGEETEEEESTKVTESTEKCTGTTFPPTSQGWPPQPTSRTLESENQSTNGIVNLADIKVVNKYQGESETEIETLSDDSLDTDIQEASDSDSEESDLGSATKDGSDNNGGDQPTTEGYSSVYAHVLPFFLSDNGKPKICVATGKELKRLKKSIIKSLLEEPELQRAMLASPLMREMKVMYMEKTKTEDHDSFCTKTKGCRCEIHKGAHEAMGKCRLNKRSEESSWLSNSRCLFLF